ncbi:MAG: EH signature domain-containing protein [Nitrospirota bacterium]|nr:EH signature domain-containing protein [Nitrospirota bacterium]
MLSDTDAIHSLDRALAGALAALCIPTTEFGRPAIVERAAQQAEAAFRGAATARPSKEDASQAVHVFMRGLPLNQHQCHLVASALCEPFREQQGVRAVGDRLFDGLLQQYEAQATSGKLWRLTWYGLLTSYFSFDPAKASKNERDGWSKLREMLRRTWPDIDRESGSGLAPDWIKVMRMESQLLTDTAADKYSADYLDGRTEGVTQLVEDLGIHQSSWFWHSLVLGAVHRCCNFKDDVEFKTRIPRVLELLNARPVFRDQALEIILTRYHQCSSTEVHQQLCDFVVSKDVWRNPKLKAAGYATAWNRVPEPVWQMVLAWVNEANLKLFFELLAGRSGSDSGRLEFWSRYLGQITWTRLIFGSETVALARSNPEIRNLLAQEEGAYATLTSNKEVDAFMMQIGDYIVVEFSKKPNACNVYKTSLLQFDRHANSYHGGTDDLKYGYHPGRAAVHFPHPPGWEPGAEAKLKTIGIYPDKNSIKCKAAGSSSLASISRVIPAPVSTHTTTPDGLARAPRNAMFSIENVLKLVSNYSGARINDERSTSSYKGRLWVEDPQQNAALGKALQRWYFKWSNTRNAWYFPED